MKIISKTKPYLDVDKPCCEMMKKVLAAGVYKVNEGNSNEPNFMWWDTDGSIHNHYMKLKVSFCPFCSEVIET